MDVLIMLCVVSGMVSPASQTSTLTCRIGLKPKTTALQCLQAYALGTKSLPWSSSASTFEAVLTCGLGMTVMWGGMSFVLGFCAFGVGFKFSTGIDLLAATLSILRTSECGSVVTLCSAASLNRTTLSMGPLITEPEQIPGAACDLTRSERIENSHVAANAQKRYCHIF